MRSRSAFPLNRCFFYFSRAVARVRRLLRRRCQARNARRDMQKMTMLSGLSSAGLMIAAVRVLIS